LNADPAEKAPQTLLNPPQSGTGGATRRPNGTILRRVVRVTSVSLVLLPMLTFACGIIVNGLGRDAVGVACTIGLASLALDALALVFAILALAVIALRQR
jgi:hypothetical protein